MNTLTKSEFESLFKQIEESGFNCVAGPIENSIAYKKIKNTILKEQANENDPLKISITVDAKKMSEIIAHEVGKVINQRRYAGK